MSLSLKHETVYCLAWRQQQPERNTYLGSTAQHQVGERWKWAWMAQTQNLQATATGQVEQQGAVAHTCAGTAQALLRGLLEL